MEVKRESEVDQSCPTPSDPMDSSLPGSSAHGIFQGRALEWGAIAFSERFPKTLKRELPAIPLLGVYSDKTVIQEMHAPLHSQQPI